MPTEHVAGKPRIGKSVYYFNLKRLTGIGYTRGYGGRAEGPYHAVVTNNLGQGLTLRIYFPGIQSIEIEGVPFKGEGNAEGEKGWWEWASPLDGARAAKEDKTTER